MLADFHVCISKGNRKIKKQVDLKFFPCTNTTPGKIQFFISIKFNCISENNESNKPKSESQKKNIRK